MFDLFLFENIFRFLDSNSKYRLVNKMFRNLFDRNILININVKKLLCSEKSEIDQIKVFKNIRVDVMHFSNILDLLENGEVSKNIKICTIKVFTVYDLSKLCKIKNMTTLRKFNLTNNLYFTFDFNIVPVTVSSLKISNLLDIIGNINNLVNLQSLTISSEWKYLNSINLEKLTKLRKLHLNNSFLQRTNFEIQGINKLTNLEELIINKLNNINIEKFNNLKKLKFLDLEWNGINTINFDYLNKLDNLVFLNLSYNNLETIENFSEGMFPNLAQLKLDRNNLTSLDFLSLPNVLPKLSILGISGNFITSLEYITNLKKIKYINVKKNHINFKSKETHKILKDILSNCPDFESMMTSEGSYNKNFIRIMFQ